MLLLVGLIHFWLAPCDINKILNESIFRLQNSWAENAPKNTFILHKLPIHTDFNTIHMALFNPSKYKMQVLNYN